MTKEEHDTCIKQTWGGAAIVGVILMILLLIFGVPFLKSLFVGVLVFVVLGAILSAIRCEEEHEKVALTPSAPAPAPKPESKPEPAAEPKVEMPPAPAPEPAPEPAMKEEPAPEPPAAPVEPTADAGEGAKPVTLDGARDGKADDLKKIKGVGPKLEQLLNSMGFYHFDQIAAWTGDEVAWVDQNLEGFKGRVTRDNWVEQAKLLAEGGETDFSKKVDKGDVY